MSDRQVQLLAAALGILAGAALGVVTGVGLTGVLLMGGFIAGHAALKVLQPSNAVLTAIPWLSVLVHAFLVLAVIYLAENPRLLGGWTLIVVFGALFGYGLIRLIVSTRSQ